MREQHISAAAGTGHPRPQMSPHRAWEQSQPYFTHGMHRPSCSNRGVHAAHQSLWHISASTPRPKVKAWPPMPTLESQGCPGLAQPFSHIAGQKGHPRALGTSPTTSGPGRAELDHLPTRSGSGWLFPTTH